MATIEYTCPITGEQKRVRFPAGTEPECFYGAAATREQIDDYEKKHKGRELHRQPHQKAV